MPDIKRKPQRLPKIQMTRGAYGTPRWRWALGHMFGQGLCCIADGLISVLSLGFLQSDFALRHAFNGAYKQAAKARRSESGSG